MSKQALAVQVRLMKNMSKAALDLETNFANNSAEEKMLFINEDMELLKVLVGENSSTYKDMLFKKNAVQAKFYENKSKAEYF